MNEVLDEVEVWRSQGDRVALATVVGTRRSAPRPAGAKMAINEHGQIAGAVSGGCVEGAVATAAYEVLETGTPRLLQLRDRRRGGVRGRAPVRWRDRRLHRGAAWIDRRLAAG